VVRAAKHADGRYWTALSQVPERDAAGYAGEAEWFMDYWNADGSYAEMCGNGVRVFTRFLLDSGLSVGDAVATRAGVVRVHVGESISAGLPLPRIGGTSEASGYRGTIVDCGNPHLVCPVPDLSTLDLSRPPAYDESVFPSGVNVEFVEGTRMRVYERGSGETLSCGSGACAVAAVTLRDAGRPTGTVDVDVPGGRLTVTLTEDTCWLSGPAVIVAHGTVTL
jgi:diaminopimelate epimerase